MMKREEGEKMEGSGKNGKNVSKRKRGDKREGKDGAQIKEMRRKEMEEGEKKVRRKPFK